jgi:hypothetical protein
VLDHSACRYFSDTFTAQIAPVYQRYHCSREHFFVTEPAVGGVATCKGNPRASNNGDATKGVRHPIFP